MDNSQSGHWGHDNMIKNLLGKKRMITMNRRPSSRIIGQPGNSSPEETRDRLTLVFDRQVLNSKDCYEYKDEEPNIFSSNSKLRHFVIVPIQWRDAMLMLG